MLSLNRIGAFKLMTNGQVEHDAAIVKAMKYIMDEQGEDLAFLEKILEEPMFYLPNRVIKKEVVQPFTQ
jgi:hypothetical protein